MALIQTLPKLDREIAISSQITSKIGQLSNPEQSIMKALIQVQMIVNATPLDVAQPTDRMMIEFITKQIVKYYDRFTVEELVKAAELNTLGEYGEKLKPFGSITWDFICDLMKAYKIRKQVTMAELTRRNSDKLALEQPTQPDHENAYNGLKRIFDETGQPPIGWDYSSAYDWAWSNKLFSQSKDEMLKWYETESRLISAELTKQIASCSNFIERQALERKREGNWIKQECRKRWMIKHFTESPAH